MKELRDRAFEILDELEASDANLDNMVPWDIFVRIFSVHEDVYILVLKADLPILEKFASGVSIQGIASSLGIAYKGVSDVANLWGVDPMKRTLDFNPLLMYYEGMTPIIMLAHINDILHTPIDEKTAELVIYNIERYFDLKSFIEEKEMP